eukprot:TRINITY_DN16016_c0_g1_i1.p1 TRINITY_DN16016_c0_g1~~TRINITY_DN16016_c0_g1_i1.p1  ORF type:complete len:117 (-),score=29.26 TRINITY_DN16016_c0_g1_i1:14-364(-)
MKININQTCGNSFDIDIEENSSVFDLRTKIEDESGIHFEILEIQDSKGNILDDEKILKDSIDNELVLNFNLSGGGEMFSCADHFEPQIKCCCCVFGCGSEWKSCQLFCAHCNCTIL